MKNHYLLAHHILSSIDRIEQYTIEMTEQQFLDNFLVQDGVMRNIEIIAEASKKIPEEIRNKFPEIPWREIMAMRNKIIHEYFGVDLQTIWNVIQEDLPKLKIQVIRIKDGN